MFLGFLALGSAHAELWISEFVAFNTNGRTDEDGETSDWLEIYNGTPKAVDLGGWFLTDDPNDLTKWIFSSTPLDPGERLVVFASNKDRDAGELHTNFRLSNTNGFLALVRPDGLTIEHAYDHYPMQYPDVAYGYPGATTTATLLEPASEMRYQSASDGLPDDTWMENAFDGASWLPGTNGIGYSGGALNYDPWLQTVLPQPASAAFTRFTFTAPAQDRLGTLNIRYDDGFAAYLNGFLIASRNAPLELSTASMATASHEGPLAGQVETVDLSAFNHLLREPLPEGVVASWDALTTTNGMLLDAEGESHGELRGPTLAIDPDRGQVLNFDGNDLVVIPTDPKFNLLDFTISLWVRTTQGLNPNDRVVSRDNVNGIQRMSWAMRTGWNNGGRPMFQVGQNPPDFLSVAESRKSLSTGWHHLVGVRKAGDKVRIYVDGALEGEGPDYIEAAISNDAPVTIGGYLYGSLEGLYFRGRIDQFRIYNRALDSREIARAYATSGLRHAQTNVENVLAIQALNHDVADEGLLLQAELTSSLATLNPAGSPGYMLPTPFGGNGEHYPSVAPVPEVSHPDGIYPTNITVSLLTNVPGATVRYTLNGTEPNELSTVWTGPITLSPPIRLRVRQYMPGWLPSRVVDFHYLDAAITINEFLASNTSVNPDNVDLEDYSDWVEIHNRSSQMVDLSGYFLSDNPNNPQKWFFPKGTFLGANGMLLVWADDHDAAPGDLVQRDYSPYLVERLIRIHANYAISADGESLLLHSPGGTLLDRVDFGTQLTDVSMGRSVSDPDTWLYFGEPTPGAPNTTLGATNAVRTAPVDFSVSGGVYGAPQELVLSTIDPDAVIRWTANGSRPTSQSQLFSGPIAVEESMVIRAASFKEGQLKSTERVEVYLFDTNSTLPIVSLAAYPNTLYDPLIGIFSNTIKKREMPVHIDFYEADGSGEFHLDAGMKLVGYVILDSPQKAVSIDLDNRWGAEEVIYPIFPNRDYQNYKGFILRAGGQDGDVAYIREGLINTLFEGQLDLDYQAYRPVRLYLNGKYHGLYNIRERQDLDYLRSNHPSVGGAEIDYIEHDVIPTVVMDGEKGEYEDLIAYMETNDLAMAESYAHVASRMDVNEFINFQIASIYMGRHSTDHNVKFWKSEPNGRWRWVVFDVDQMWTFPYFDILSHVTSPVPQARSPLWSTIELRALLENPSFRDEFIHRFVTQIHTLYAPDRVHPIMDALKAIIDPEMPSQIARWPSRIPSLEVWDQNLAVVRAFTDQRPGFQISHIKTKFGLGDMSPLTVSFDAGGGSVLVHGMVVETGFTANYFDGVPVRLEAVPRVGHRFAGWTDGNQTNQEPEILVDATGGAAWTASFEPDPDTQRLPDIINGDFTLTQGPSAWVADGDITVAPGSRLVLEPGATLLMPDKANLLVQGSLEVRGTAENPVIIAANPNSGARHPLYTTQEPTWPEGRDHRWGALILDHPDQPILLQHLRFSGSSLVPLNPDLRAGITAFDADLTMEHLHIDDVRMPILTFGGRVALRDSFIRITATGDGINVKGAEYATVERCEFTGGTSVDTDAIDYDQIMSGQILSNHIHGFLGSNSDAIDLGEGSTDIWIDGNHIHDCTDKGVSVGQASVGLITRNLIVRCDMGVAVKDQGSQAYVDRCTFFDNRLAVAAYEKNLGEGGGQAQVVNSILAFSRDAAVFIDPLSSITIDYCLANTERLPGAGNLFDGPEFVGPGLLDFRLRPNSSAIDAGHPSAVPDPDGSRADMGAIPYQPLTNGLRAAGLVITEIHYNPSPLQGADDDIEFVEIYNLNPEPVALQGYAFVSGIQFTFPEGSVIGPHQYLVVAKNKFIYEGQGFPVYQWTSGNLDNGGEAIELVDPDGYAVDVVQYGDEDPWPNAPDGDGPSLMILNPELANAAAWNWRAGSNFGGTPGGANWIWAGDIQMSAGEGTLQLSWGAMSGSVYQLERCLSLDDGEWLPVGGPVLAINYQVVFTVDLTNPVNQAAAHGFYRARLVFP